MAVEVKEWQVVVDVIERETPSRANDILGRCVQAQAKYTHLGCRESTAFGEYVASVYLYSLPSLRSATLVAF
jgi:hypothetical protein